MPDSLTKTTKQFVQLPEGGDHIKQRINLWSKNSFENDDAISCKISLDSVQILKRTTINIIVNLENEL